MMKRCSFLIILCVLATMFAMAQQDGIKWVPDGTGFYEVQDGNIVKVDPKTEAAIVLVKKESLQPKNASTSLVPQSFDFSYDKSKLLLFTNTAKVWRYNTRGDYWVYNVANNNLTKLGNGLAPQSLMFAKFSPDSKQVAYVSEHNIFVEDVATGQIKKLTNNGTRKFINGTFDWAYEEEFNCRDGFRWSPDSKQIAFWQIDATKIRDYYMLNTTDSPYSKVIPVEYPKVGESPSPASILVVNVAGGQIRKMNIEGDPQQHYITRMEWSGPNELIVQQLNRKQQESKLMYCKVSDGSSYTFWAESDDAWVDLNTDNPVGWNWINQGKDFLWVSEKDGWRHIYKISRDGKTTTLLTKGNYDIGKLLAVDELNNYIYFSASPNNATQLYLYRVRILNGKDEPELVTLGKLKGTHEYEIGPFAKFALHSFSNSNTPPVSEWLTLPDLKVTSAAKSIANNIKTDTRKNIEYLQIVTEDNILLDAWINKPNNFDASKQYPVVFYVYGEPAASTVNDEYGAHTNYLYNGNMSGDGYIQVSIDNRGTPSLKGAKWRKSIYRKIGNINIRDYAMGAKKILEAPYMDKNRVAVWGWSGGGSSTLNLMFKYPEIFKTGVAIAAVGNQLNYDNIYQERYMGLPQENLEDFVKGSPVNNVKGLQGKLLYIHGTGDDNVHYDNAEMLLNELIRYNKQFEFMAYPNRSHSISEGAGTFIHLATLYTNFIKKNCPPGAK
ncbi:S9 family peptidase [Ferruginibacter yonginensis]|uniref:S9 family peptidase n=1 Tax=Ferruginibacter yonginensis TaxID=1310416 RepID=A0ABV8QVW2_9BACT